MLWKLGFVVHLCVVVSIATAAYMGLISTMPFRFQNADLLGHAILIGLLAFFLDGALGFRPLLRGRLGFLRLGPTIILCLAAAEELAQVLSPRRSSSLSDFAADLFGIVVLSWLARRISRGGSPAAKQTES